MPFLLAVDNLMQFNHPALQLSRPVEQRDSSATKEVLQRYRHHFQRLNGTVLLSKQRYREMRRIAIQLGTDVERSLLVGGESLPGRVHTDEVFLALSGPRCRELRGWRARNAERLAAAAALRGGTAPLYDRLGQDVGTEHLKIVVRPGEAEFVK